eukprot:scaffold57590_cov34-Prasinocladus_malaysianus.AAC.4
MVASHSFIVLMGQSARQGYYLSALSDCIGGRLLTNPPPGDRKDCRMQSTLLHTTRWCPNNGRPRSIVTREDRPERDNDCALSKALEKWGCNMRDAEIYDVKRTRDVLFGPLAPWYAEEEDLSHPHAE